MVKAQTAALVLSYAACGTCKKALKWLAGRGVSTSLRPIVEAPPTRRELDAWIAASGLPTRKWLNTSGQSYRAIGKDAVVAASDDTLRGWLVADGKLVKRPVVVVGPPEDPVTVLVGFDEQAYGAQFP